MTTTPGGIVSASPTASYVSTRHPATANILQFFEYSHLPEHLQPISKGCRDLAFDMADRLEDGPELTAGLRKLLEAKDCFVRAALPEHPGPRRVGP